MNGLFNNNFMIGYLLAKDRPKKEAFSVGLTAGQFPKNNLMGPLLLKKEIDKTKELERSKADIEKKLNAVTAQLEDLENCKAKVTELEDQVKELESRKAEIETNLETFAGYLKDGNATIIAKNEKICIVVKDIFSSIIPKFPVEGIIVYNIDSPPSPQSLSPSAKKK